MCVPKIPVEGANVESLVAEATKRVHASNVLVDGLPGCPGDSNTAGMLSNISQLESRKVPFHQWHLVMSVLYHKHTLDPYS